MIITKPIKSYYLIINNFYEFNFEFGKIGEAMNGRTIGISKYNTITDIKTGAKVPYEYFEDYLNYDDEDFNIIDKNTEKHFDEWSENSLVKDLEKIKQFKGSMYFEEDEDGNIYLCKNLKYWKRENKV